MYMSVLGETLDDVRKLTGTYKDFEQYAETMAEKGVDTVELIVSGGPHLTPDTNPHADLWGWKVTARADGVNWIAGRYYERPETGAATVDTDYRFTSEDAEEAYYEGRKQSLQLMTEWGQELEEYCIETETTVLEQDTPKPTDA